MSTYTGYWQLVTPKTRKQLYTTVAADAYDPRHQSADSASSITWYSQVMKGPGSRMQTYKQYDSMDGDIDIARSLDIIAEEMSGRDEKTDLPFEIKWQTEDNQDIADSTIVTVRAALRQWSQLQDFKKRLFSISRCLIKYGDCIFFKTSDTKKWQYVDMSNIVGIRIDQDKNKVTYQIRKPTENINSYSIATSQEVLEIPASAVIHFTLSDDMGDSAPYGQSILRPIFRVYRQFSMLEDASIIYKIVRAPERRVFYIDVGNSNPQQVKRYLESVKNEMRQRRSPTAYSGAKESVDGQYDPQCLVMDTKIPLLDGRTLTIQQLSDEYMLGKKNWAFSCHPVTGEIKPGEIVWAGKTRKNAELIKVTLDNGKSITCTPDHMFPILGRGFVRADQLENTMSLVSFETKYTAISKSKTEYGQVFDHSKNKFLSIHSLVNKEVNGKFIAPPDQHAVTHHKNFNPLDNHPENLMWLGHKDHFKYHSTLAKDSWNLLPSELKARRIENIKIGSKAGVALMSEEAKIEARRKQGQGMKLSYVAQRQNAELWEQYISKLSVALQGPRSHVSRKMTGTKTNMSNQPLMFNQEMLGMLVGITKENQLKKKETLKALQLNEEFLSSFAANNSPNDKYTTYKIKTDKFSDKALKRLLEYFNIKSWRIFVSEVVPNYNHKVVSVEYLAERQDTGCITIGESQHDWHTFATDSGVFVKNSLQEDFFFPVTAAGRSSKVETLPGGSEDFGNNLLKQFQEKIFRGLRIPTSYMSGQEGQGAQSNDGKVGIAYIEELRFAKFISRQQDRLNEILDAEFKIYLKVCGLKIDDELFNIKLPDPANFALYRQAALDADLISSFQNIQEVKFLSRRFILKRYLGLSDDEIQMNEIQMKEERDIKETSSVSSMQQMYDPAVYESRDAITVEGSPAGEPTAGMDVEPGGEDLKKNTGFEDTEPGSREDSAGGDTLDISEPNAANEKEPVEK